MKTIGQYALALLTPTILVAGCSGGPSDEQLLAATKKALNGTDYDKIKERGDYACGFTNAKILDVTGVAVVQRGDHSDGSWPVRVRVSGSCEGQFPHCGSGAELCPAEKKTFTSTAPVGLVLTKDSYGEWSAYLGK